MRRLGKREAIADTRIPRMSVVTGGRLPPPPPESNWWARITDGWPMLMNDDLGCCVPAAMLHCIQQMSTYAGRPLMPTDAEVIKFYEATGYNPLDASTDQGSYVLGNEGLLPYWHTHGVRCGGVLDKAGAFMRIMRPDEIEWQQGVALFGGMLVGMILPAIIAEDNPYVWRDYSGPSDGGHEVWCNGYLHVGGELLFDIVSWGKRHRMTLDFMKACVDEVAVLIDPVEMNARGLNAADMNLSQLTNDMKLLV